MTLELHGASPDDPGPAGCVVRFLIAGDARDGEACRAELHEDSLAQAEGAPEPPPMRRATVGAPIPHPDRSEVPVDFVAEDGSEPRFVFVVRPSATASRGLGIDLDATMQATFGGDPAQIMVDAMQQAFAPLGEAMENLAEGLGAALSGGVAGTGGVSGRRPLRADEPLPATADVQVPPVELEVVQLEFTRSWTRAFGEDGAIPDAALRLRCQFELAADLVLEACAGLTLDAAEDLDGADLRPDAAADDLGAERYSSWEQEGRDWGFALQLRPPPATFRGLARLAGRIRLQLGTGPGYELAAGRLADLVDRRLHVAALDTAFDFGRDDSGAFTVQAPYGALDDLDLAFVDGEGQEIGSGYSGFGDGETSTRCYDPDLPDEATVLLRFAPPGEVVEVPFTTRGLPFVLD
jgi:hypothetical protein